LKEHKEITGNSLRTYLYLVSHGASELREVQRGIGLSTPSLASYHLSRLVEAGYAIQDNDGKYVAVKDSSTQVLEGYAKIGTALVPQFLFFTVLFTVLILYFSMMTLTSSVYAVYLVATSICAVALLWYESFRLWRKLVVDSNNKQKAP
jgi:hypothetical protein